MVYLYRLALTATSLVKRSSCVELDCLLTESERRSNTVSTISAHTSKKKRRALLVLVHGVDRILVMIQNEYWFKGHRSVKNSHTQYFIHCMCTRSNRALDKGQTINTGFILGVFVHVCKKSPWSKLVCR